MNQQVKVRVNKPVKVGETITFRKGTNLKFAEYHTATLESIDSVDFYASSTYLDVTLSDIKKREDHVSGLPAFEVHLVLIPNNQEVSA